jgi:hypothetical protein
LELLIIFNEIVQKLFKYPILCKGGLDCGFEGCQKAVKTEYATKKWVVG